MNCPEERGDIMAVTNSEELKDFISSTLQSVKSGLKEEDYLVAGTVEFELAVVKTKKKGAGLRIYVVDASAKYNKEVISRIKFQAVPKNSRVGRALR